VFITLYAVTVRYVVKFAEFRWECGCAIWFLGAFLAAAIWGGQWGGHICIWGANNFRMTMRDW